MQPICIRFSRKIRTVGFVGDYCICLQAKKHFRLDIFVFRRVTLEDILRRPSSSEFVIAWKSRFLICISTYSCFIVTVLKKEKKLNHQFESTTRHRTSRSSLVSLVIKSIRCLKFSMLITVEMDSLLARDERNKLWIILVKRELKIRPYTRWCLRRKESKYATISS